MFDENRNFSPLFDDDHRETIECESVLLTVGQTVDLRFVDPERDDIELTDRGFIACDAESGRTGNPDIFVAGDLAYGPKLLIHAVASGKRVARSIYETVTGRAISHRDVELHLAAPEYARETGYERIPRVQLSATSVAERMRSHATSVEIGLTEQEARREAGRCLDCGVNTIFDGSKCILCGGCVDVCPSECLRIVSVDRLSGEPAFDEVLSRQLDGTPPADASAIIKDETICIRCALCAERCPTGAITMERFLFKEVLGCRNA